MKLKLKNSYKVKRLLYHLRIIEHLIRDGASADFIKPIADEVLAELSELTSKNY